mmetsp:Transcript_12561/g.29555  ORF Transcript_12561/g.29555 Transcript_12561/m.29555 type:complete len:951 (-) Transcript_12561:69-2921(-)
MEACEALGKADYKANKLTTHSPALVALLRHKTSEWKEKNANVLKGCFLGVNECAKQSAEGTNTFDRGAALVMIAIGVEKLADKKMAPAVKDMLTSLAQATSPRFLCEELVKPLKDVKPPAAHQEAADWFAGTVKAFGVVGVGDKIVAGYAMAEFEALKKDVKTKDKVVALVAECHRQKGPNWVKKFFKAWPKDLETAATKLFDKVGYDAKAAAEEAAGFKKGHGAGDDPQAGAAGEREEFKVDKDLVAALEDPEAKKWKARKDAMDSVIASCDGMDLKYNKGMADLAKGLGACLADKQVNNKPLAATALAALFTALEPGDCKTLLKEVTKPLMEACADNKEPMRQAAVTAIDRACSYGEPAEEAAEKEGDPPKVVYPNVDGKCVEVVVKAMCGKDEGLVKATARKPLLEWLAERLAQCPVQTSCKELVNPDSGAQLLSCMNDKNKQVREHALAVMALVYQKRGATKKVINGALDSLKGAAAKTTKEALDKIFDEVTVEPKPGEEAKPSAKEAREAKEAAGGAKDKGDDKADAKDAKKPKASVKKGAKEAAPAKGKVGKKGAEPEPEGLALKPNKTKSKREKDAKKNRWPAPPDGGNPGKPESEMLLALWEKSIEPPFLDKFFPKKQGSMECGNAGIELIHAAVAEGDPPDLFIGHLDLIFKWMTLRMCEKESTPTLVRMLEVLLEMFKACKEPHAYELADFEVDIIMPYLCEKSGGGGKERVVEAFREIMEVASTVIRPSKYAPFFVKALKTKNSKSQAACLTELARVISLHGSGVVKKKDWEPVEKALASKDKAVREGALQTISEVYLSLESSAKKTLKLFGTLDPKSKALVETRLKTVKSKEPDPPPAAEGDGAAAAKADQGASGSAEAKPGAEGGAAVAALVGARDLLGSTPLHWAAARGHSETCRWLVTHGGDPKAKSLRGETPADLAKRHHHKNIVAELAVYSRL